MTTFKTSRKISATVEQVFAAFQPERLARWWGPAGFTNTFSICEFKNGGRWSFTMHGPDGRNYPNENVFGEIEAPMKVVIEHASEPKYRLTITFEPSAERARVFWARYFKIQKLLAVLNISSSPPMSKILSAYPLKFCGNKPVLPSSSIAA